MTEKKVEVFKWVKKKRPFDEDNPHATRDYSEWALSFIGAFLQFGNDYEEFETGPGNFTCALIKDDDGKVHMVRADMIRFLKDLPKS